MEYEIIQFSRLRLVNSLPRFVEALQGKSGVGEITVTKLPIRFKAQGLPCDPRCFLILPL